MKRTILVIALLCGWVNAQGAVSWVQYDTSTKLVILPTNLFLANTSALTAALTAAGWSPGGGGWGTGNASTNATQAWASGYTNTANGRWVFNGALLAGSTNIVQKLGNIELALTGYQPLDTDLTALALLNGAGLTNLSASTAFSSGTVPIARLATGTPDGTKFVRDDGTLAVPSGTGVSLSGTNAFTGPNSFDNTVTINGAANLNGTTTISNLTVPGTLSVGSITADTPLGTSIGGTGGTNPVTARSSLGVTYDVDVQAYRPGLLQIALAMTADGHMPLHNGSIITNLATTAAGRALLTAASASVQWNSHLLSVASTNGAYDATSWDGVSDRLVTLDQFRDFAQGLAVGSNAITSVQSPLHLTNGVLSIDTSGLGSGGGGAWRYLVTNSTGAWQGRDSSTNWTILSATISSNDVPAATGRFLEGGWSLMVSNNSGSTATLYHDVSVNGSLVFRDSYSLSSGAGVAQRAVAAQFWLIRESSTTAALVQMGQNANSSSTPFGQGDFGSMQNAATIVSTNIAVTWSSNVSLSFAISCDTSTSTNAALGIKTVNSWIRSDATTSTSSGSIAADGTTVTNIVSSDSVTNTVAGGQTTLSVRPSGVTAGTYSNVVATIGADGRITSAESATNATYSTLSAGTVTATSVSGDGSGLTNINGSNIASGTVPDARLSSGLQTLATGEGGGLTAASQATNATQFVTLAQLRASSQGGQPSYFNLAQGAYGFGGFTSSTTNLNSLTAVSTITTNAGAALNAGDYVAFFISTNTYSSIADGLVVATVFCFESSAGIPTIKAEVYLINSVTKQIEYEYGPSPAYQTVPTTLGGLVFSVPVTARSTGTNVHVAIGIKQGASGTVRLVTGGVYDSHITFPIPNTLMVLKSGDTMTGPLTLSATAAPGTSNNVAASTKYVNDAVALASGGTFDPLAYYSDAEFLVSSEANSGYYGIPLLSGAAINGGAAALASSANIAVSGLNGIIRLRGAASLNSGWQYVSDTAAVCITGGEYFGAIWYSQATNVGTRVIAGFTDSKTTTAPTDGIYAEQIDNALRFVAVANGVTNAGASTFYVPSNSIVRVQGSLSGTNSVSVAVYTNGVSAMTDTITGGLPAGVDRVTGVGVVTYHTNNVALNLMYIDKVWFGRASTSR